MPSPPAIGIDIGCTSIKSAVVREGEIVERGRSFDTQALGSPRAVCDALGAEVERLCESHPSVAALGVGVPGLVDPASGVVDELANVPGWKNVPLRQILQERTALPVSVDNDGKAMTYAEWRFGAARNRRNAVCMALGTGVGGGLILDGKLFRGSINGAGEIGQATIDLRGAAGFCGNFGALEKYVGNRQIAERACEAYGQAGDKRSADDCSPAALAKAAATGDPVALTIWKEVGTEIGAALAGIVWLLNPDCIVVGGGVASAGECLLEPIRASVRGRTTARYYECLSIVPAALGSDAGVIGAAALGVAMEDEEEEEK